MTRKTIGLAYPTNPLAAMRDLQDLDVDVNRRYHATSSAESSEVAQKPSSERFNAESSVDSSATSSKVAQKGARKRSSEPKSGENPIADAVSELLRKPYVADHRKGPFTVSTIKIPTEVWERLGWVSTLTGQPKQVIITEALKTHFEQVLKQQK